MARTNPVRKLSRKLLKLIERDLKRIEGMIGDGPPGMFALTLTRYFAAVMDKEKHQGRLEDEIRAVLRKLSKKQLLDLAKQGMGDGANKITKKPQAG